MLLPRWFHRVVLAHRGVAFVVMGLAFLAFGAGSLNLFFVLRANVELVAEHGWQALADGAAMQFLELLVTGYASMAAYVVFKACEHRLVHWLTDKPAPALQAAPDPSLKPEEHPHEDRHPAR